MVSRNRDNFEITDVCSTEQEILKSSDLHRFLKIFNRELGLSVENIDQNINSALKAYFQFRKLRGVKTPQITSTIKFLNNLNLILVEKAINESHLMKFNREYLEFFTENARIFMNRGYVPVLVNSNDGSFCAPIYPADDQHSKNNGKLIEAYDSDNTGIELRKLPQGITYTNFVESPDPKVILAKADTEAGLGFAAENECSQAVFATVSYDRDKGQRIIADSIKWSGSVSVPRGTISSELLEQNRQYGVALFEGIGVERDKDGVIRIFRLEEHAERMSKGGQFFDMPPIPADIYKKMVIDCVAANKEFAPECGKGRLYIRPNWFDKGPRLHVKNSSLQALTMTAVVIGSMESYFEKGKKTFFVPQNLFRATENGAGQTKAAGNYAPSIRVNNRAKELGMTGVLYMNEDKSRIEETLASSFIRIIKRDGQIILQTPKLSNGTILDSITRKTILTLAKEELCWIVEECDISPNEAFVPQEAVMGYYAVGTGAGIAPIHSIKIGNFNNENGEIQSLGEEIEISKYNEENPIGEEGKKLMEVLLGAKNNLLIKIKQDQLSNTEDLAQRKRLQDLIETYQSWLTAAD